MLSVRTRGFANGPAAARIQHGSRLPPGRRSWMITLTG
jgi:hypothetical protein